MTKSARVRTRSRSMRFFPILPTPGASTRYAAVLLIFLVSRVFCQSNYGELHLQVTDTSGLGIQSSVQVASEANQYHAMLRTSAQGNLDLQRLPFGIYSLEITQPGFAPVAESITI